MNAQKDRFHLYLLGARKKNSDDKKPRPS